eukprot:2945509-Pleurochrysis_carterae.AAC.1
MEITEQRQGDGEGVEGSSADHQKSQGGVRDGRLVLEAVRQNCVTGLARDVGSKGMCTKTVDVVETIEKRNTKIVMRIANPRVIDKQGIYGRVRIFYAVLKPTGFNTPS